MTEPIHKTFVYFPFLHMRDTNETDFGFLKIWNFSRLKDNQIQDEDTRAHLVKILETHRTMHGPLKDIGVVSIDGTSFFDSIQRDQLALIREAKLILFLSFVARNNTRAFNPNSGHWMAASENFQEVYQSFVVGNEYVAEFDGYVIPSSHGGLKLGEFQRLQPGYVPTPLRFEIDNELFAGLLELRGKRPRLFQRIINASELIFESYHNSHSVSRNARVLLQTSAFEILLQLPERNQRQNFKDTVEALSGLPGERSYIYYFETRPGRKQRESRTRKGIWADRFYTLRNHIIHGSTPPDSEYLFSFRSRSSQRHTDIVLLFFVLFVKRKIEKSLRKTMFSDDIVWKKWEDDNTLTQGEGFVYEQMSFRRLWPRIMRKYFRARRSS